MLFAFFPLYLKINIMKMMFMKKNVNFIVY